MLYTFGEGNHAAITAAVKKYSASGMFSTWEMRKGEHGRYAFN